MIKFEKELLSFLDLPSIPRKEWDGKTEFDKGVAVVSLYGGYEAYAIASFNPENGDLKPKVTKVFGVEPFNDILHIYIVPGYMDKDIDNSDLDDLSKKRANDILKEAQEIENEGTDIIDIDVTKNEWVFDEIHNLEEAQAWLKAYNVRNKINGRIPSKEETIKLRLLAIKSELDSRTK